MNALASELDDIMRVLFSNKSFLCFQYVYGFTYEPPEGQRFYFGTPASRKIITDTSEYDHATFTASAAAKTVAGTDLTKELAYVEEGPTWDLDGSLEAHQKTVNVDGIDYDLYLCQVDGSGHVLNRERHRRLHVAEIIIEGWPTGTDFDFETEWNKYHFLRFHNLDNEERTINLPGGGTIVIPSFGIQAVRRSYKLGSTWDTTYRYLWKCQAGDQLIFDGLHGSSRANNVASMVCYHDWIDLIINGVNPYNRGAISDPTICWDGSSFLPQAIGSSTRFAEYYFRLGDVLSVDEASTTATPTRGVMESWSSLEGAGTQGLVGAVSVDSIEISKTGSRTAPVDAVGFGTNLIPSNAVTLPYTATAPRPSVTVGGQKVSVVTLERGYGSGPTVVATDVDQSVSSLGWGTNASVTAWSTLGTIEALVAGEPSDETTTLTDQLFKSDGWRFLQTGKVVYDLSTCPDLDGNLDSATWGSSYVSIPWSEDLFARTTWAHTASRVGRKLSENSGYESGGTVYYEGHPDLDGFAGLAAGVDWNAARVAPVASVVKKTEEAPSMTQTNNLPVIPLTDAADRIAANYATSGWWATNRTALLAGPSVDDQQRIVRLPILREHFNHVAERLNSIVSIRPFLFEDVLWYGSLADGGWFSGINENVDKYYCPVLSTGSRADELGLTVYSATYEEDLGPDQTNYYVKADEVAAISASLGFPFLLERMESPRYQRIDDFDYRMFSSEDWDDVFRYHSNAIVIAHHTSLTAGMLWPPADWVDVSAAYVAPIFKHERYVEEVSDLPSSWTLNTDSKFLIVPRPILNWDNDPIADGIDPVTLNPIPDGDEPISVVDALTTGGTLVYGSASVSGVMDPTAIATLIGESLVDGREAFEVRLINRLYYQRT